MGAHKQYIDTRYKILCSRESRFGDFGCMCIWLTGDLDERYPAICPKRIICLATYHFITVRHRTNHGYRYYQGYVNAYVSV